MNGESGSHDLAPKDPGTKDCYPTQIDFGTGKAKSTPAPSGEPKCKQADSKPAFGEYESFNKGGNPSGEAMDISSKHNGGQEGTNGRPTGM